MSRDKRNKISRREFIRSTAGGMGVSLFGGILPVDLAAETPLNDLFWVKGIPDNPFYSSVQEHYHAGVDTLLSLMGKQGLKFYRSPQTSRLSGPSGMIAPDDVVLIKVNAQWKYRGCTNSDLVRGVVQRILDHPDIFSGEVVIFENGQGRGSLNCDTKGGSTYQDEKVHANANNEKHSFLYLVDEIFDDPRVSSYLLDPIRTTFIGDTDHQTDGYRIFENISYPCFTTAAGQRIELREGIWNGNGYAQNLKLINIPVLKHHDRGGSEITASLKHFYGVLSMRDGRSSYRHYAGLGDTCGRMVVSVRTPVLNILDAVWVSHASLKGYPSETTHRVNQILAGQDPVALDYWAAKYILYPIDSNPRHHPDYPGIQLWLEGAKNRINGRGGLQDPHGIVIVSKVTKEEDRMSVHVRQAKSFALSGKALDGDSRSALSGVVLTGLPGNPVTDSSGKYTARVFPGWQGTVKPEKEGLYFKPESRTYSGVNSDLHDQNYSGFATLMAPLNFSGQKKTNRSLTQVEYINILRWEPNPANQNVTAYRLYEKTDDNLSLLAEFGSGVFEHWIRGVAKDKAYVYALTAVNAAGREGASVTFTIL
ncbi:MAG: DUF362 domain-containing protein [Candidatus Aminicenantes bacterium]|nr:DUF362 domain-containing protein [Candidatus Aminicenantes bacterium]